MSSGSAAYRKEAEETQIMGSVLVIGGGAAGLMASCAAAHVLKKRGSVLVLEGNAKLGRKLLATGNGRCNLTNLNVSPAHYHGDVTAIQDLLHEYTPKEIGRAHV